MLGLVVCFDADRSFIFLMCLQDCCSDATTFNPTPPCVYAPQGYQADSYLYSLASTLMLSYPIISNGRDGNQSTLHQDHVEMLHKNAFRQQRVFINEMLSGKVKLPSYVIAAQLCHCSPNRRPCQLPGGQKPETSPC